VSGPGRDGNGAVSRPRSLRAVLAAGAARVRTERGWSETAAADLLRSYGLVSWQPGTLTQVEAGVRPLSVEELLLLCAAYGVSLAELAGSDPDQVELAAGARLPAAAVRALLADDGEVLRALPADALDVPATRPVTAVPPPGALVDAAARLGVRGSTEVGRALAAIGDAERNAARKLGVTPERLVLAAVGRWGKPFTAERDARIALRRSTTEPDRHITLRGLVTRELLAELEQQLAVR
jgi:transcriptional regulator with XRE-family HTH domain